MRNEKRKTKILGRENGQREKEWLTLAGPIAQGRKSEERERNARGIYLVVVQKMQGVHSHKERKTEGIFLLV